MAAANQTSQILRILLVEDENQIGRIIELGMTGLGVPYEFISVLSAEEGLEQWQAQPFDLLMTDYNLRGMDGLRLINILKQQGEQAPMVLITAYDSPQLARAAREAGVAAYIPKPFFIDQMIEQIRELLPMSERALNDRSAA